MDRFTHLHVHSHYSILDGMSKVPDLIDRALKLGMHSIALTDHGNMYGIKELMDTAGSVNAPIKKRIKALEKEIEELKSGSVPSDHPSDRTVDAILEEIKVAKDSLFKPIAGVEAYCARRSLYLKDKDVKEYNPETGRERIIDASGWHLVLLAKNKKGYQNLCKIVSTAWIDGNYFRPRIDKELLEKYHEGLICSSACLGGEIPQLIIAGKTDEAEKSIRWFQNLFGDDYYLEIQRHKTDLPRSDRRVFERQQQVNPVILELAKKTGVKVIATNDVHFVLREHAEAHDRLICLNTGKKLNDEDRMHYTKQEWLKSPDEMQEIFQDVPEALSNTQEIVNKVEYYSIDSDPIMPKFDIPTDFGTEEEYRQRFTEEDLFNEFTRNEKGETVLSQEEAEKKIHKLGGYEKLYRIKLEADYLNKLAWDGAHMRYGENLTEEIKSQITFELHIMKTMGFPGYFLIVSDYIRAAREELGVSVGPGRGSAAGSVVAYCLRITDVDPLKYDLLFERFLNPDRISLPDIDVDFDDDGRGRVLDWVTQKYGKEKVAHIITYGTMAAKSAIADVGRVQEVPLPIVNEWKKLVPDALPDTIKNEKGKTPKPTLSNCLKYLPEFQSRFQASDQNEKDMITYAAELEGTIRQVGIHACGVIIGADDLTNFAPMSTVYDKETGQDVIVTQYDGHVIEQVGLIKMDFLGLSTLSIIKEALKNIYKRTGEQVDIDHIPLDDELTYQLYQRGDTIGTFQFESAGMQEHLRNLQPTVFEDLIAMNALYRPGPMDNIPEFIKRKQGIKEIRYEIDVMSKYLSDTYGITVYQEQVMLLSRLLADFTRGESDALRKAMGKKKKDIVDKMKPQFIEGGKKNGHDEKILEHIWSEWEKFASYAFNKSHATCYSWVAYQTAWLKAHYPADFMAANLTRNRDDITKVSKFMDECRRMGIDVLGPDINESDLNFTVNKEGAIRFGLGGVKGVGEGAVESIIQEREKNGPYVSIYDFMERINMTSCNRGTLESLGLAGAFDNFGDGSKREQFFVRTNIEKRPTFNEALIEYGRTVQNDRLQNTNTLFGDLGGDAIEIQRPPLNATQQWNFLEKLGWEKDCIGIYLSSHPLDEYYCEFRSFVTVQCKEMEEWMKKTTEGDSPRGKDFTMAGIVTDTYNGVTKTNNPYGRFTIEDYSGSYTFALFGENYIEYKKYMQKDLYILVRGHIADRRERYNNFHPKVGDSLTLDANIKQVMLLNDVCQKMAERLTVYLDSDRLQPDFVTNFGRMMKSGNVEGERHGHISLHIVFQKKNRNIPTRARNIWVDMNREVKEFLKTNQERHLLEFKLS